MIYAIGENKIVRAKDDGTTLAEVHFELLRPGVYEITEVLTASTDEEDIDLEKVMQKTAEHMQKNAYRVYTRDPFAREWFDSHPEFDDILTNNRTTVHRRDRADAVSSEMRYGDGSSWVDDADESASRDSRKSRRSSSTRKGSEKKSSRPIEEDELSYEEALSAEGRLKGRLVDAKEIPSAGSRKVGRVFQWICAFLAALCGLLFFMAYSANVGEISQSLSSTAQGRIAFSTLSFGYGGFCVLLFLWVLTRRRFHTKTENLRLDTGRGILGFLLLLILLAVASSLTSIAEHHISVANAYAPVSMGILGFLTVLKVYRRYIALSAVLGVAFSVARQFLGR